MEHVTKEKHVVRDGKETYSVRSENRDGRSVGDKIEDAKNAYKTGPEDLARETKVSSHSDGNRTSTEYKSEVKDPRSVGDKLADAKDAFSGKN
ncbi:hypothetical protein BV898_01549 [Hypsibius exemplaris]|uniref:Uncharacterized protein n=1 Tax=Hypsibius exemplaris TaxID=2072580 RepID=A0A1W0XAE1_HYPEX|nr:hypothetical protein BV898_01549 [Hypsibius exemplaris]